MQVRIQSEILSENSLLDLRLMPFCQRFPNQPPILVRVPDGDSDTSEEEEESGTDKGGENEDEDGG